MIKIQEIITDLKEIKEICKDEEEENNEFRLFLKSDYFKENEFKRIVKETEEKIDCTKCAHCCRFMGIVLNDEDINRISTYLRKDKEDFIKNYLSKNKEKEWQIKQKPCPFLKENKCEIYSVRPKLCREFPHLHKDITTRSLQFIENAENCPLVFNVLEKIKDSNSYYDYEEGTEGSLEEFWEEEQKKIEKMSPEERKKYEAKMKKETEPIIKNFFLSANHFVFDDDWDWQIASLKQKSPEAEKIINFSQLRKQYENNMPEYCQKKIYLEETEEIKSKDKLAENDEDKCWEVLDAIEDGLMQIAEHNNDLGLMDALKQLKSNILNKDKNISQDALSIKFALMPELMTYNYCRKEIVLCLQHFIKLIRKTRNEEGKNVFRNDLLKRKEELDAESDEDYLDEV